MRYLKIVFNFFILYLQRSKGGGVFEVLDMLNGEFFCGYNDVYVCVW